MSKQPFYVGQRVVCVDCVFHATYNEIIPKKGQILTVRRIYFDVDEWYCQFNEIVNEIREYWQRTDECDFAANQFAPITEQYTDIREELANQVVIGDTVDQEVRVLS